MLFALLESSRSALASVLAHGLRSFLTTLGIVIGVAGVIAVVSLTEGLSASVSDQFQALGTDSLTLRSYTPLEALISKPTTISSGELTVEGLTMRFISKPIVNIFAAKSAIHRRQRTKPGREAK